MIPHESAFPVTVRLAQFRSVRKMRAGILERHLNRVSTWEPAVPAAIGAGMLLWMRRFGPFGTEHVVTIEYTDFEDVPPYYQATCDCGWDGPQRQFEGPAREDGHRHAPDVLTPIEDFSEP